MLTSRRNFLGLLAAPAIVRASSLMRVVPKRLDWTTGAGLDWGDPVIVDVSDLVMERGEWRGIEFYEEVDVRTFARLYAHAEDEMLRAFL